MSAELLSTHTPALFDRAVRRAVELLSDGHVVALPTETVYGLAAHAFDPAAVARIFAIKGRPAHNPLIVHVASADLAEACSSGWPEHARRLAAKFWPGPLTLVVPRSPRIPALVTAGGPTVALRWPQHPFMQAVIRGCGFPLAAPSANLANQLSPTSAAHVAAQLGDLVPLIVDGGDCNVGIESTVVDVTGSVPRILRPGMIAAGAVAEACGLDPGEVTASTPAPSATEDEARRSPGMLSRHYSPRARLCVRVWCNEEELKRVVAGESGDPARTWIIAHSRIPLSGFFPHVMLIPEDAEAYARALYGELHRCDASDAELIVVEAVPETGAWAGIADRLRRAAL